MTQKRFGPSVFVVVTLLAGSVFTISARRGETTFPPQQASQPAAEHEKVLAFVANIQRADHEADLDQLRRHYDNMPTRGYPPVIEARLRYWKGFAMWRRAINGFNLSVAVGELANDTRSAVAEFERSAELDPEFADAKIALISCYQLLTVFSASPTQVKELVAKFVPLLKEIAATAPNNPRFLWVKGQSEWYTPPGTPEKEVEARQSRAIATYTKGLAEARRTANGSGTLDPVWGEPELLMNLAWANLNRTNPDLVAAESFARDALELVPYWRYVRDRLLPQIVAAKR